MDDLDDSLLAELALPPSAKVAFQAVKANQREKNSKEALISHITDQGCIFFPKIEFFINHYLEALSFLWSEMPISG